MHYLKVRFDLFRKPTHHELEMLESSLENLIEDYDLVEDLAVDHESCTHYNAFKDIPNKED